MSQRAVGLLWAKMKFISLLLLFLEQIQGSTEMIQKFLPTGERSSINFPANDLAKSCVFSKSDKIIGICPYYGKPTLMENFIGKVELSCPASLIFTSPQTSDCGVYSAQLIGDQTKRVNVSITFQDPVSPVELKLHVNPDSSCKATCSTEDDEVIDTSLSCDNKSCHLAGGERSKVTKSGASLRLYQSNESIICNHSNQVIWTQSKKEINICVRSEGSTLQTTLIVVAGIIVAAIIGVPLYCYIKKKLCFAQRQTGSSNSQTLPQSQANGDPRVIPESDRLMNGNTAESPV